MKKLLFLFIFLIFSCSSFQNIEEQDIEINFNSSKSELVENLIVFSTDRSIRIYMESKEVIEIFNDECDIDGIKCEVGLSPFSVGYNIDNSRPFFIYKLQKEKLTFPLKLTLGIKGNVKEKLEIDINKK